MLLRYLLLFIISLNILYAKQMHWYDKIYPSVEAGLHYADLQGSVSNTQSVSDFRDDFGYLDSYSSYFALGLKLDYNYAPNFHISYFNNKEYADANLSKSTSVANGVFDANSSISSIVDYQVINFTIYQDFKHKGNRVKFLRFKFYPGDIDFYVGINLKIIDWKFEISDTPKSLEYKYWVHVAEKIPLPFIGFKYYYYNLRLYANASALSFSEAKSTNYEFGLDYRVIDSLYLNVSYLYEDFKATERRDSNIDIVEFKTVGNKFGFKYLF